MKQKSVKAQAVQDLKPEMTLEMHLAEAKRLKQEEDSNKRLVLFTKRYVRSRPYIGTSMNLTKIHAAGTYSTDQELIDELIATGADVEIYGRIK